MTGPLPRRVALGLLASAVAGAALPLAAVPRASAQLGPVPVGGGAGLPAGLHLSGVVVDASRVARLGDPAGADGVTRVMTRELQRVFADLMTPRGTAGATLVARISSLHLSDCVGTRSYNGKDGGGSPDNLEGVGIVSSGGRVLTEVPILSVLDAAYSGTWAQPDIDGKRVEALCQHFAWWLRRETGL